jgi:hypothetical protein
VLLQQRLAIAPGVRRDERKYVDRIRRPYSLRLTTVARRAFSIACTLSASSVLS